MTQCHSAAAVKAEEIVHVTYVKRRESMPRAHVSLALTKIDANTRGAAPRIYLYVLAATVKKVKARQDKTETDCA